ncbi:hypothetical protein [Streptomyces sp. NBC_01451]|uniref:hypothetical protein n=1 Tax=Streptomyces sp. NBC_01451 TaxID=2903872 RepID=UPI002E2FE91A|nr:hypothetical protein [Streptomyces sp. NBC_01451]
MRDIVVLLSISDIGDISGSRDTAHGHIGVGDVADIADAVHDDRMLYLLSLLS